MIGNKCLHINLEHATVTYLFPDGIEMQAAALYCPDCHQTWVAEDDWQAISRRQSDLDAKDNNQSRRPGPATAHLN